MIDVTKYKPVIDRVLAKLRVKPGQKEDMVQECYVALLEKIKHIEHGLETSRDEELATTICWSRVVDVWRKENQSHPNHKEKIEVRISSLSDPRIYQKAIKVISPEVGENREVTTWELEDALLKLPFEDYRVLHELYAEDKTLEATSTTLGLTVDQVRVRKDRGVKALRKYFGGKHGA